MNKLESGCSEAQMTLEVSGIPGVENLITSWKLSKPLRVLFEAFSVQLGTFTVLLRTFIVFFLLIYHIYHMNRPEEKKVISDLRTD